MIDTCLGVNAIGLGITGVSLLSICSVAAPAVIGMEEVSIVMGLLRVVGNRAIKRCRWKYKNMKRLRCWLFQRLTLSVVSFQKHYPITQFQVKNIHQFYWSLKRSHERKKTTE